MESLCDSPLLLDRILRERLSDLSLLKRILSMSVEHVLFVSMMSLEGLQMRAVLRAKAWSIEGITLVSVFNRG
jgi:hypothetical protein